MFSEVSVCSQGGLPAGGGWFCLGGGLSPGGLPPMVGTHFCPYELFISDYFLTLT